MLYILIFVSKLWGVGCKHRAMVAYFGEKNGEQRIRVLLRTSSERHRGTRPDGSRVRCTGLRPAVSVGLGQRNRVRTRRRAPVCFGGAWATHDPVRGGHGLRLAV